MKSILLVGLSYSGPEIDGVDISTLGLCTTAANEERSAKPLYEYDVVVINPQSFSHFLFGEEGKFSYDTRELEKLKQDNKRYDLDSAFDHRDRVKELDAAIAGGTNVVWCLAEPRRMNFFGYRETYLGYAAPKIHRFINRSSLISKSGRQIDTIDRDNRFSFYFDAIRADGWKYCLSGPVDGYTSIASTPEGYSLGGKVELGTTCGWLVTPPNSIGAANALVRACIGLEKENPAQEKYHGLFLCHTSADKPLVRRLRDYLSGYGVEDIWIDEAEILIGDSLLTKISEGINNSRFIGVALSPRSVGQPWVQRELEIAINREIETGQVVVLPLLYEKCDLPLFLRGKLYADFTDPSEYENTIAKLLRRLRIS